MDLVQNGLISILVVQILSTFAIKGYSGLAASPLQGGVIKYSLVGSTDPHTPRKSRVNVSKPIRMAARVACCAHCGTKEKELTRCARCKQTCYCGAECQKRAWKLHKNTCE
ncbi:hypothetical protein T484DRAFT_1635053, partial [Baffinella frigidus]